MFRQGRLAHFVSVLCSACIFSWVLHPAAVAVCATGRDSIINGEILVQVIDCEPTDDLAQRMVTSTWRDSFQKDNFEKYLHVSSPANRIEPSFGEDYGAVVIAKILRVVVPPKPFQTRINTNQKDYPQEADHRYDSQIGKTYAFHARPTGQNRCHEFTKGRQLQMWLGYYCCDTLPTPLPCSLLVELALERTRK